MQSPQLRVAKLTHAQPAFDPHNPSRIVNGLDELEVKWTRLGFSRIVNGLDKPEVKWTRLGFTCISIALINGSS